MVQTHYLLHAAALAYLGSAGVAFEHGHLDEREYKPTLTLHQVEVNDKFIHKVATGLNSITGPGSEETVVNHQGVAGVASAAAGAAGAVGAGIAGAAGVKSSTSRNVVYVTKTAYFDENAAVKRSVAPHAGKRGWFGKRADNTKYTQEDLDLAAQLKPYMKQSNDQTEIRIKHYTDANGNFQADKAAQDVAQMIQMAEMYLRTMGGGILGSKRSANADVDAEAGHMLIELGARLLAENEEGGLGKRANGISQADLIKGLKPMIQLGYDSYRSVKYDSYDDAAKDAAYRFNAMSDGRLDFMPNNLVETDASRSLANDISPIAHYARERADRVLKAYSDSKGQFDVDRAANDIARAGVLMQRLRGLNLLSRDVYDAGYMMVDLGTQALQGQTSGLAKRDLSHDDIVKQVKPLLVKGYKIYSRFNDRFTHDGQFDINLAISKGAQGMISYSNEFAKMRQAQGQQQ